MQDSEYSQVDPVTTPGDTQTARHHVVDYELQKLLSQGWQRYNARVREGLDDLPAATWQAVEALEGREIPISEHAST